MRSLFSKTFGNGVIGIDFEVSVAKEIMYVCRDAHDGIRIEGSITACTQSDMLCNGTNCFPSTVLGQPPL